MRLSYRIRRRTGNHRLHICNTDSIRRDRHPCGEIGKYIVTQRRAGDKWYIGGITGTEARTLTFVPELPEGSYTMKIFRDGINATSRGEDYTVETSEWTSGSEISIDTAPGGGFAIIIERK